jgi:hypothetical protein
MLRLAQRPAGPYAVAFAVPVLVLCALARLRAQFPLGPGSRGFNDLGNAYVPLHAQLRDLLHGHASGDLFLAWNAALGAPLLPDYVVNLASPFAPLVALFPRDRIELAVFVVTIVKTGLRAWRWPGTSGPHTAVRAGSPPCWASVTGCAPGASTTRPTCRCGSTG